MTSYLLSGPAAEPVTLDEAKAFLRLDSTDEDALVTSLITAARLHIEGISGCALLSQGWRTVLDCWPPGSAVTLPVGPLLSLTAITAYDADGDGTSLAIDDVLVAANASPPQLFVPPGFGSAVILRDRQGIEIDYAAGYGSDAADVPASLRQALLILVGYWFENRDSVIIAGGGSVIPDGLRSPGRALSAGAALIALADTRTPPLGSLRDRVQIKRRDVSPEDEGGSIATYVPIATVWARVRELSSSRTQLGDGRAVSISHSVVLRYRTDINPGDRLVYRGQDLDVVGAADLNGQRAYLSCACSETNFTG